MILILLGAPGSGKGTQAGVISERYGIPHISTGDIFRKNIKEGTQLGRKAKEYIDKGLLVPDEVTNGIVESRILENDCGEGFILDGYPRTTDQAQVLETYLGKMGKSIDAVLNIDVPDEQVVERLSGRFMCRCGETYHTAYKKPEVEGICNKCGKELYQRDDDKPETVIERLREYYRKTAPIIDYYNGKGLLVRIDGTPMPDKVTELIEKFLEESGYGTRR
ncbi:MAG: adenylate kinase [Clostridia bacterium]|nr:adenylate kinase [Clostridia bacterium]MBN2884009.1 adenylate kinase [Clostridia bacterium]